MRDFKILDIWKRGILLTKMIYEISRNFPNEEKFGLQSQMRRASTSIPINIAEGCGRDSLKDFAHFIHIAEGSASELECEIIIAVELGYITDDLAAPAVDEIFQIRKMMNSYKSKIKNTLNRNNL
ncbi:MAG: four helix bundle protein [Bacteroidales bacterium]|nr:four helix bundle protein [Bacteroidales bacterium]